MLTSDDLCSLRWDATAGTVAIIDQTLLPHTLRWCHLDSLEAFCHAIASMQVRGAPLIGVTAAFGLANALSRDPSSNNLEVARAALLATRPTAVNLHWALRRVVHEVADLPPEQRADRALDCARRLREEDITSCSRIGERGLELLRALPVEGRLNIMTHCNAGWLATIQWGTALAPIYKAHAAGMPVHVWVSETRPRNQGTNLTAWELQRAGVPCTVVAERWGLVSRPWRRGSMAYPFTSPCRYRLSTWIARRGEIFLSRSVMPRKYWQSRAWMRRVKTWR
jgi:methylthioribose-1-phosphate isomerase